MNQPPEQPSIQPSVLAETLRVYFAAFAEPNRAHRKQLLSRCLTQDAEIWGPRYLFKGYESISDKIDGFQSRMPLMSLTNR
jgi:hypothetical protein